MSTEKACWQSTFSSLPGTTERAESPWTVLNVSEYSGDEEQQELWFAKGWEEPIQQILEGLTTKCGPLVLVPDTGDEPKVIAT